MTDLSPAAQAVLDAFLADWQDEPMIQDRQCLAAALRAAAGQVAPLPPPLNSGDPERLKGIWDERRTIRAELLAIATELESTNG
jgi:hypothetical protein